ncbi:SGNH/GDSL hydrolase family protein [Jatrophihabitans sp. YIM 134969]
MTDVVWEYSNLPVRPSGNVLRVLGKVVPGIRATHGEVDPYATAWQRHNAAAVAADGPLWIVLGDSMAQGIGASAFDRGWPGQLADRLDPALRMVNLSAYGARVVDVVERQLPAACALGEAALVTVVIGSNDVVWRRYRSDLPDTFARMVEALPPRSVVSNLPNPNQAARAVDRILATRGVERGLVVADIRRHPINWRGKLAKDFFHPNDAGYAAMADVIEPAVREALAG